MACVAHLANHLAYDLKEHLDGLHCRAEAVYKFPIAITILLGGFFLGRGVVRTIASREFDYSIATARVLERSIPVILM
jgi:hypothetical protein